MYRYIYICIHARTRDLICFNVTLGNCGSGYSSVSLGGTESSTFAGGGAGPSSGGEGLARATASPPPSSPPTAPLPPAWAAPVVGAAAGAAGNLVGYPFDTVKARTTRYRMKRRSLFWSRWSSSAQSRS